MALKRSQGGVTDEPVDAVLRPREFNRPGQVADVITPDVVTSHVVQMAKDVVRGLDNLSVRRIGDAVIGHHLPNCRGPVSGQSGGRASCQFINEPVKVSGVSDHRLGEVQLAGKEFLSVRGIDRDSARGQHGCRLVELDAVARGRPGW